MSEHNTTFEGWAILELMGHRRLIGRLSTATIAGASFLRIDIPQQDGAEATQFYSPSAVYAITPTTEELARRAAHLNAIAPVSRFELPKLAAPIGQSDDDRAADVIDFLERYTNEQVALDNDVLDRLDAAIEQAELARLGLDDDDCENELSGGDKAEIEAARESWR